MWTVDLVQALGYLYAINPNILIYKIQGNEIWTTGGEVYKINTSGAGSPIDLIPGVDWRD